MKIIFDFKILVGLFTLFLIIVIYAFTGNDSAISNIEPRQISPQTGIKIIAFGDSLTAGYGLPLNDAYPAQLETRLSELGFITTVINSGVSGETTRGNLERAEFIRNQNPDIVLLGIGGNDALRLLPLEETKQNIKKTISILKGGKNPPVVVLLQMKGPLNAGLSYAVDFKEMYEEFADEYDLVLVPFITVELFLKSEYKLPDGIHYNKAGYGQVIELYLLEAILKIIEKMNE
jgi:acyl-CoA thioesterase-1